MAGASNVSTGAHNLTSTALVALAALTSVPAAPIVCMQVKEVLYSAKSDFQDVLVRSWFRARGVRLTSSPAPRFSSRKPTAACSCLTVAYS